MAHGSADPAITVMAAGVQQASGAASAGGTLPNTLNGKPPVKVRVSATAAAAIRLGVGGVTATAADTMVQPGDALTLRVPVGVTNFAVIQITAGGLVQISALEDA